jgi:2-iminobutanoate/2-iminopropanoate deaminase
MNLEENASMGLSQVVTEKSLLPKFAYSQGLIANGFLFTQGVNPCDPQTGKVVGHVIELQTEQAMKNLSAILGAAGLTTRNIVKSSVHLADLLRDFEAFDRVYSSFLEPPYPARTTVGVTLWHDYLIEIDVVAALRP